MCVSCRRTWRWRSYVQEESDRPSSGHRTRERDHRIQAFPRMADRVSEGLQDRPGRSQGHSNQGEGTRCNQEALHKLPNELESGEHKGLRELGERHPNPVLLRLRR